MNHVHLIGRLTRDVELKKTQSGVSVVSFTLAVNRPKQKDKEQEADYISCQAWRGTADALDRYTGKGSKIAVNGRIQTRNYDDRDGKKVYVTEVVVNDVEFLDNKKQSNHEQQYEPPTPVSSYQNAYNYGLENNFDMGISSDDLPF